MTPELGPLAVALAKAQSEFAPVTRDKKVTVKTKTGGTYEFSYAPLDQILNVVRKPLSDNGLALAQLLDTEALVTILIHESGAYLEARTPYPETGDIQGYGSAVTYLRRYAIQALLGIAAEDDDDGNRAAGNTAAPRKRDSGFVDEPPPTHATGLIGTVEVGKNPVDMQVRITKEHGIAWGFKLKNGRRSYQVLAYGPLADALSMAGPDLAGQRVEVWGSIDMIPWDKDGKAMPPYPRIRLERIKTDEWTLPAVDAVAPGQASFDLADSQRVDAEAIEA